MKKTYRITLVTNIIILLQIITINVATAKPDQIPYTIINKANNIEIREYPQIHVAVTEMTGKQIISARNGAKKLIKYINKENTTKEKLTLIIPVMQKINVTQDNKWLVYISLPYYYNLNILPKPNDPTIKLEQVHARKIIAITFSGTMSDHNIQKNQKILDEFIKKEHLKTKGGPFFAFYSAPWIPPFLKRNEIMIELTNYK